MNREKGREQKLRVVIASFLIIFIFVILSFFNTAEAAIVHCGRLQDDPNTTDINEKNPCTSCDLLVLVNRAINFGLFTFAPAAATLLFLYAGFLILFGGAKPDWYKKGKDIFKTTIWGLVMIFMAWLAVDIILKALARGSDVSDKWYEVRCYNPTTGQPPTTSQPPTANEDLRRGQEVAKRILENSSSITLSTSADCGGSNHARQNIVDIANGRFPSVCSTSCACQPGGPNGNISPNWQMLEGIIGLAERMKINYNKSITITVSSLTTGKHGGGSSHYNGEAVDIIINSSDPSHWQAARAFLRGFNGSSAICERKSDKKNDRDCNLQDVNHIHWTLRRS